MKLFVANRGEIAVRIARAARSLQIPSVGVYTPPDAQAPHRWLLDTAVPLAHARGYMDVPALLNIACVHGATAVHPGYGFLSQDPRFAEAVLAAGLLWVGPPPAAMLAIGDKRAARRRASALNIPIIPGAEDVHSIEDVYLQGERLGYPLLLKAAAAGGGRGLRRLDGPEAVADGWAAASREAQQAVGDGRMLVERWLQNVRHIEVQVMADTERAQAIGTRECSLQRRYQKVLEEGPCDQLDAEVLAALCACAERLFVDVGYVGAGTAEFLVDDAGRYHFLEVNPRLQVEHPVTEETLGIDLVAWQLAVCAGASLPETRPLARGHAIEVRLTAEDPSAGFVPSSGEVLLVHWPQGPGVRVDAGVAEGSHVSPHYDALLAKIIAWAPSREQARRRLLAALQETVLLGVAHNLSYLQAALAHPDFIARATYTTTLASWPWHSPQLPPAVQQAASARVQPAREAAAAPQAQASPWSRADGFGRSPCGI